MFSVGWRNLSQNPRRMAVAVFGIVFAVVLVTVETGMLLGLMQNASLLIDRSRAEIWVATVNAKTFDFATPQAQRKRYLIESVPGVERVEEYNVTYSMWKLPTGGNANCQVVGFDPRGTLAANLDLVEGSLDDLNNQDAIIIDEGERAKLDNPKLGEFVEIFARRARIVGFTRGMRSFTTTPYVFTSIEKGRLYGWQRAAEETAGAEQSIYFLVKLRPGADVRAVQRDIEAAVPDVEAHTREGFSRRTRSYWLIETGMGLGFLVAALLGMAVGGVVVSQTLYAITMEKLAEFGVLKAMGATMRELAEVVLSQALICGASGLTIGILISLLVAWAATAAGTTVLVPALLLAAVTLLTAVLCSSAALASIVRLRRVEPASVFRS